MIAQKLLLGHREQVWAQRTSQFCKRDHRPRKFGLGPSYESGRMLGQDASVLWTIIFAYPSACFNSTTISDMKLQNRPKLSKFICEGLCRVLAFSCQFWPYTAAIYHKRTPVEFDACFSAQNIQATKTHLGRLSLPHLLVGKNIRPLWPSILK